MKFKLIFTLLVSFLIGLTAQATIVPEPYYPESTETGPFGQEHFYSVLFRGNGEVVVGAKIITSNGTKVPINDLEVEILDLNVGQVSFFQEICRNKTTKQILSNTECNRSYRDNPNEIVYQKLDFDQSENTYSVDLNAYIDSFQSGVVLMHYRGFGYAKNGLFGRKNFDFLTLRVDDNITTAKISVNVDTDLFFEGQKSSIDYAYTGFDTAMTAGSEFKESAALQDFSRRVGSYGKINKTANYLLPNETFHVKGVYAKTWFGLYYLKLFIGILILAGIIGTVFLINWRVKNKKETIKKQVIFQKDRQSLPLHFAAITGLIGALIIPIIIYIAMKVPEWIDDLVRHNDLATLLVVILIIITIIISILALPVYYGFRNRPKDGLMVFFWQIFFLIFVIMFIAATNLGENIRF